MTDNTIKSNRIRHDVLLPKDIGNDQTIWKSVGDACFDKEVVGSIELLGVR